VTGDLLNPNRASLMVVGEKKWVSLIPKASARLSRIPGQFSRVPCHARV